MGNDGVVGGGRVVLILMVVVVVGVATVVVVVLVRHSKCHQSHKCDMCKNFRALVNV